MTSVITKVSYFIVGGVAVICLLNGVRLLLRAANNRLETRLDFDSD